MARDNKGFEALVLEHQDRVYNLAYRMTGNVEDAFDITQEVFFKAYTSFDKFKGDSSFYTWIYKIARNFCIDFLRRSKKYTLIPMYDQEDNPLQLPDDAASTEDIVLNALLLEDIHAALNQLDAGAREIVVLRDINHFSYEEISQILDMNVGTVKSKISRARLKLRNQLIKNGNYSENHSSNRVEGGDKSE